MQPKEKVLLNAFLLYFWHFFGVGCIWFRQGIQGTLTVVRIQSAM